MTRHASRWVVLAACVLWAPEVGGQGPSQTVVPQSEILAALTRVATNQWRPRERESAWLGLQRELADELTRRPNGRLAAHARQAAAYVDVRITPVLARRSADLTIHVDVRPRFELDTPIPSLIDIHGSLDGGEWFRIGVFAGGQGCGGKLEATGVWRQGLGNGFHHLDLSADIRFLRTPLRDMPECRIASRGLTEVPPDIGAQEIIQRERRALPGVSFGISPDFLGAPAVSAQTFDAELSNISITRWMSQVMALVPGTSPASAASWMAGFCEPEESLVFEGLSSEPWRNAHAARRRPRAVCVMFLETLSDDRLLLLQLRVGTVNEDAGEWSIEPPSIHELSIGADHRVLDVPSLSMLPAMIMLPTDQFPALDVSIAPWDLQYEPRNAKPGDPIVITATIRNLGGRDARFTSGMLSVFDCCEPDAPFRDFVEDIPAGGDLAVSLRTKMPRWGRVLFSTLPYPANSPTRQGPYLYLLDANPENNDLMLDIGVPPPGTVGP